MKKIFIIIFLSCLSINLFSQNLESEITYSFFPVKSTTSKGYNSFYFLNKNLSSDSKNIDLEIKEGENFKIKRLDDNEVVISEDVIDISEDGKEVDTKVVINFNNKYHWIYSKWDKQEKTKNLYAKAIDLKNNRCVGEKKLIIKIEQRHKDYGDDSFNYLQSKDLSKVLLHYKKNGVGENESSEEKTYKYYVFDDNMNKVWSDDVKIPNALGFENIKYLVSKEGNVFAMIRRFDNIKTLNEEIPKYHFAIMNINGNSKVPIYLKIELTSKIVRSAQLFSDELGNIYAFGYYSNNSYAGNINGAFKTKVTFNNNTINLEDTKLYEIPASVLNLYPPDDQQNIDLKRADDAHIAGPGYFGSNLIIKDVSFNEDGSFIIIGDECFVHTSLSSVGQSVGESKATKSVYFQNIVMMNVDNNNNVLWSHKIPRNHLQFNSNIEDIKFHYHEKDNKHYLFYLDKIENKNLSTSQFPTKLEKFPLKSDKTYLACVKIDKDGKMSKDYPLTDHKGEYKGTMESFRSTSKGKVTSFVYSSGSLKKLVINIK